MSFRFSYWRPDPWVSGFACGCFFGMACRSFLDSRLRGNDREGRGNDREGCGDGV